LSITERSAGSQARAGTGGWYRKRRRLGRQALYLIMIGVAASTIVPFLWMLSTAVKEQDDAVSAEFKFFPYRAFQHVLRDGKRIRVRKLTEIGDRHEVRVRELSDDGTMGAFHVVKPEEIEERSRLYARVGNFSEAWRVGNLGRAYVNNLIVAVMVTLGQVLTSSLAAYAFARLTFPGRDKLFLAYLATMMIPGTVTLIPVFILVRKIPIWLNALFGTDFFTASFYLGPHYVGRPFGVDSYLSLIVPALFTAYGTFMLRQFFMSIPRDLDDAAKIDGAGYLRIWWHVILPLSKPALATLTIFTFMGSWRVFLWPLIIIDSPDLMPLMVALQAFRGQHGVDWPLLMAGSLIVLVPIMVVYVFGQRYFTSGIRLGALKE
jgi:multiple sugar transport system permease protein